MNLYMESRGGNKSICMLGSISHVPLILSSTLSEVLYTPLRPLAIDNDLNSTLHKHCNLLWQSLLVTFRQSCVLYSCYMLQWVEKF